MMLTWYPVYTSWITVQGGHIPEMIQVSDLIVLDEAQTCFLVWILKVFSMEHLFYSEKKILR